MIIHPIILMTIKIQICLYKKFKLFKGILPVNKDIASAKSCFMNKVDTLWGKLHKLLIWCVAGYIHRYSLSCKFQVCLLI